LTTARRARLLIFLVASDETNGRGAAPARGLPAPAPPAAAPRVTDRRGWLRRKADQVLDRVDTVGLSRALLKEAAGLARHPGATLGALSRYAAGTLVAAGAATARLAGGKAAGPVPVPAKDRRFADPVWDTNAVCFALLQHHLLRERLAHELVDAAGLDPHASRKARLASQLVIDATAPTNFLLTNPIALRRAFDSGGLSLARGARNFLEDYRLRGGSPRQFEGASFEVGKNLAATPGQVVYRNDLMELIQYAPQTPTTFAVPLLCSPPWINKYYVMDLAPGRSFIEWAVKHGHTTFAISYKNPDAAMRDIAMDDYLLRGLAAATRVVREITGAPKLNVAALCLGGTLTAIYLAWLAEHGRDEIHSVTLTNTLLDFTEPGILGNFVDEATQATIGRLMARDGYLDGQAMAGAFNLIRANDLIFNYVNNSWLGGEAPPAFDLLAWNDDATRMPAMMHAAYLRSCYLENQLARGELVVAGKRLALARIEQDAFVLAAIDDHIAPWRSQFKTTTLLGGKTRFVLSNAGHIAGIVNPPSKNAAYWTNDRLLGDPELWLAGATQRRETWWEEWSRWIDARAGERVAPPAMGSAQHPPLAPAPGVYVMGK
jgi:polyhydroxyalkanoate synthase subunit PhaC